MDLALKFLNFISEQVLRIKHGTFVWEEYEPPVLQGYCAKDNGTMKKNNIDHILYFLVSLYFNSIF